MSPPGAAPANLFMRRWHHEASLGRILPTGEAIEPMVTGIPVVSWPKFVGDVHPWGHASSGHGALRRCTDKGRCPSNAPGSSLSSLDGRVYQEISSVFGTRHFGPMRHSVNKGKGVPCRCMVHLFRCLYIPCAISGFRYRSSFTLRARGANLFFGPHGAEFQQVVESAYRT